MIAQKQLSGELSAVVFADICGFSRLMAADEERTAKRVEHAINLVKSLVKDYGGSVKNVAGDGVLALFANGSQSIKFAIQMQQECKKDAVWNSDKDPIQFRIGINLGEVRKGRIGILGHSVNLAARIQEVAAPGEICVSAAVKQTARGLENVNFRTLGQPALKNIEEPVEVFAVDPVMEGQALPTPVVHRKPLADRKKVESSIAVLPLRNITGEPQLVHLCNGLTGDIIGNLTRFHDLHVIAQRSSSAFAEKFQELGEIARKLGVRYLVDGGLQRSGSRVRILVELIEAQSELTMWSEHFDGDLDDIFDFQDEVTAVIASRLSLEVNAAELLRQRNSAPSDLQAYGLILRGKEVYRRPDRETNYHAHSLFELASSVDPNYARSYVGMSRMLNDAWRFHWADPPETALDKAMNQAEMAIGLAPSDAWGYAAFGLACLYKRQHEESLAAYERAIEFNPNDADVLAEMGHSVCCYGDPERAANLIKRAMRLNPCYPDWYLWHLGEAYFDMQDFKSAIGTLTQMHDKTEGYRMLTASHALIGDVSTANQYAEQLMATHPEFTLKHWENVPPDRNPASRERLIEGLKKAGFK
ncbi:adenylate/guanylate cyclase domain-containing protein [Roseibium sp. SCPC15]|uniref:adenylate/guanylate cyclase domain-containing protein n=1 Tax=Roseibium sp. SCP15 TaxID=3141376 RepID=UPI00333DF09A